MRRNRGSGAASVLAVSLAYTFTGAVVAHASDDEGPALQVNPIEVGVFGGIHFTDLVETRAIAGALPLTTVESSVCALPTT